MSQKEVIVVPHTHWDREWYRTFQGFRLRLVDVIDRVMALLEADVIPHFLLDGQTVVLDDYLEIKPEARDRLRGLIASGKLAIGPWYILPDEFLVSGESLIRNLQLGRRLMREFGAADPIGYLPDMFGHLAQVPQILRGFGMEQAVVWRGVDPSTERFVWRSPAGLGVTTTFLPTGYCNIFLWENLTLDERMERFQAFLAEHHHAPLLLLSGCDHIAPNPDLPQIMAEVEARWGNGTLRLGRLSEALAKEATEEIKGELRQGGRAYLLPDVLSARMPLKQLNAEVQTLWERYVEPLTALQGSLGGAYTDGYWLQGWQKILLNQPHDSICGCSIDEVHREMLGRFSEARELGETLIHRALHAFSPKGGSPGAIAFNPTTNMQSDWVPLVIEWPLGHAPESAHLVDAQGRPVPALLEQVEDTEAFYSDIDLFPGWRPVRRFQFKAHLEDVPGLGLRRVFAEAGAPELLEAQTAHGPNSIANEHLRLFIKDGSVHLQDLDTGALYPNVHAFEDGADAGDEYNYSPPQGDRMIFSELEYWHVDRCDASEAVMRVCYRLKLPQALSPDRLSRSSRMVSMPVISRFTLKAGSRLIMVDTELDNQACDHRLRVRFGTGLKQDVRVFSENQFWVSERSVTTTQPELPVAPLKEYVATTFPQQTWSAVEGDYGLMVANIGLPEAEVTAGPNGSWELVLTLLRSVGWLSRDDLRTRGGGAGPHFETPDAQCLGPQRFRYALIPYRGTWSTVQGLAHAAVAPLRVQGFGGDLTPLAGGIQLDSWFDLGDARLVLSAVKRAEGSSSLALRLYNPTDREIETELAIGIPHQDVALSNLAEEPLRSLGKERVPLRVASGEILTLVVS